MTWNVHRITLPRPRGLAVTGALVAALMAGSAGAQEATVAPAPWPAHTTAVEGLPTVRVDVTADRATRRQLTATEATAHRLRLHIKDGDIYWSSRGGQRLTPTASGDFTYLTSREPGRYVRVRRLGDRLSYVEHVDSELGSVTYSGELRIFVGK